MLCEVILLILRKAILINIIFLCTMANHSVIHIVPANNVLLPQDCFTEN